jgi:hypothetical protein
MKDILFTLFIFFLNLPFGYWRQATRKLSLNWVFAIHIPVLIIIAGRLLLHIPYSWIFLPFNVVAFFLGQYTGGRYRVKKSVS